jgi:hypothetical protein
MMRISLTRSITPVVLLASCLLIGLACATSFPIESLEEGMTAEMVRERFGAAEAMESKLEGVESAWTYLHEELDPIPLTFGPMPLRVAVASIWGVPLFWGFALLDVMSDELEGENWNHVYISRAPVVLQFEEEKLAQWEVLPDIRDSLNTGSSYYYPDPFPTMTFPTKDSIHHKKGHKHHHGH